MPTLSEGGHDVPFPQGYKLFQWIPFNSQQFYHILTVPTPFLTVPTSFLTVPYQSSQFLTIPHRSSTVPPPFPRRSPGVPRRSSQFQPFPTVRNRSQPFRTILPVLTVQEDSVWFSMIQY